MIDIASVTIGFLLLLGAMTLGLHIATVMFGVGFIGAALYLGWPGANALAMVTLAAMAAFCAWRGGAEVLELVETGKRSNTPLSVQLWIPESIWLAGMVLFAVGAVAMALHSLGLLFSDRSRLNRIYGPQSLEEEISTEIAHAGLGDAKEASRT